MITEQELIEAGYKQFKEPLSDSHKTCYQKRVWDTEGIITMYFINLYKFTYNDISSWELSMAFDCDGGACPYMWIKGAISNQSSLKDIENKARKIFESNYGIPYDWRK